MIDLLVRKETIMIHITMPVVTNRRLSRPQMGRFLKLVPRLTTKGGNPN